MSDPAVTEPDVTKRRRLLALGMRFFSSESDAERVRRPTDWLLLALSLLGLASAAFARGKAPELSQGITAFVKASPGLLGWFWELSYDALLLWALALVLASLFARRFGLLLDQVLALALALGAAMWLLDKGDFTDAMLASEPPVRFPAVRLAIAAAIIATSSPHLSRPLKRIGRWVVGLGAAAVIALGVSLPMGVLAGLMVGFGTAAIVHLIFGSPGGRPTLEQVAAALDELGVEATDLQQAGVAARGAALVSGRDGSGQLDIKVFGRDAWGGQLMAKVWDSLWFRDSAEGLSAGPLQQVEREAFVALLAERQGVPVMPVSAAGMTAEGDALLVTRSSGTPLAEASPDLVSDEFLGSLWDAQHGLEKLRISHGLLDADHVVVLPGGGPGIRHFSASSAAAPPQLLMRDRAQLLVTTSLVVGVERAVDAAAGTLGGEALGAIVPYLQPAAMSSSTRVAMHGSQLKELRRATADAAGIELPKLEQLRRVTWGSLGMAAILLVAAYFLITSIAGIGLDTIVNQLAEADQAWLWGALIMGVVAQVGQAFSTMGAAIMPVRFSASLALQFAIQFMALAVPSSAARVAMNVRFFQRNGASAPAAITIGAIDSFSGFIIQALVVLFVLISGAFTFDLQLNNGSSGSSSGTSPLLVVTVALTVLAVAVAIAVPKYRRMIKEKLVAARDQLRVLRSPTKLLMLFGGNLFGQVLLAASLGMCLRAFGHHLPLAELLFINTLVALFAGFMPVPGGIGVAEAATSTCLVAAGIPSSVAMSTAVMFRMMTFYLPPIWGSLATGWLRKREYL